MKYFIAIVLIAAVASARVIKPIGASESQEIQEIIAAINSPSTDPATAALLEQMLMEALGVQPIQVGPAIVEQNPSDLISVGPAIVEGISPISVGPAIIDFPLPDGGAVTELEPTPAVVAPAPVVVGPTPAAEASESSPLVQIIVNVNAANAGSNPVGVISPEAVAEPEIAPEPVSVVEQPILIPTPVVLPQPVAPVVVPEPVIVVEEPSLPEPVIVVEPSLPVAPTPIGVGEPVLPIGVQPVVLPETLN
ncbi:calphotin-like [Pectinophora gossypiella]|uniref:calphotin-like n=1 Tax=Pectinophora gossypiella TaxID=13191 RepID=UPI00214E9E2B|nr:calphotin-like [Pectinophora gossypiella]